MADNKSKVIYIGLLFLLFIIPLGRLPISFSESLNLPQLIILYTVFSLFLFICWLILSLFKEKNNLVKSNLLYAPLGLFFLWGALSLAWTVSLPATFTQIFHFSFYLPAFFLAFNAIENDKKREKFLWVLLFSAFFVAIYAVHQYFWGLEETRQFFLIYKTEIQVASHKNFISRLYTDRAFSTFLYPNTLATFLMLVLPFAVFSAIFCDNKNDDATRIIARRVIFSALSLLVLFAFVLTFSKGGTVVLILSWLLFLLFKVPKSRKIIAVAGFVLLISFIIFVAYNGNYVADKLQPVKDSSRVRIEYWRAALEMFKEKPLNGFGWGSFGRAYAKYKLPKAEETQAVHNNFLQIGTELGIIGFLMFLSIFIFYFIEIDKRIKNADNLSPLQKVFVYGGFVSVLSFALHSLGDFSFYVFSVTSIFFMIMGVSLSVCSKEEKFKNKKLLFASLFIISGFVITLLFRIFTAEAHYLKAMNSKDINEVIEELEFSTRSWTFGEDEYRMSYHYLLSQMYKQKMIQERKDFSDEILGQLQQAVKYDKCRSLYWRELALMTSLLRNDKDKSVEYMQRAISLYPTLGENYLVFGDIYMIFGEKEKASKQYKIAYEYNPSLKEKINERIRESE
ncbi:MAG: O-antigen ligase family protein [Candidatus Ratteibacteria bacterium]|nr:O-antigen ligase family protein [Candidatus Ratteibacteria bacterium]